VTKSRTVFVHAADVASIPLKQQRQLREQGKIVRLDENRSVGENQRRCSK
jgi:hypothetical protein